MFAKLITSRFAYPRQPGTGINGILRREVAENRQCASVRSVGRNPENGKKIDYPARPLLGFTGEDVQMIEEIILAHLER